MRLSALVIIPWISSARPQDTWFYPWLWCWADQFHLLPGSAKIRIASIVLYTRSALFHTFQHRTPTCQLFISIRLTLARSLRVFSVLSCIPTHIFAIAHRSFPCILGPMTPTKNPFLWEIHYCGKTTLEVNHIYAPNLYSAFQVIHKPSSNCHFLSVKP